MTLQKVKHILIIEKNPAVAESFTSYFFKKDFICHLSANLEDGLNYLKTKLLPGCFELGLLICEIETLDPKELVQLSELKALLPATPFIAIVDEKLKTKVSQVLDHGFFHYLIRPFEFSQIVHLFEHAINYQMINKEISILKKELLSKNTFQGVIGRSSSMRKVFELIKQVAPSTANILIQGPTGSGKEVIARALHNLSERKDKPFVAINCSAIPENLLESELFGHIKGSFTGATQNKRGLFEEANGGTLFLDEIGDFPHNLQAKLLRVLQERTVRAVGDNHFRPIDIRIICATHKNLKDLIINQQFRDDLYYRLAVIPVNLPSLSERTEDIPLLAHHFLSKFAILNHKDISTFSEPALNFLYTYSWPGNVRELENAIERAVVLCKTRQIELKDIHFSALGSNDIILSQLESELPTLEQLEKRYIEFVLKKTNYKKEKAAEILGLNRKTLYRKERDYGWDKLPQSSSDNEII
ncbi:MAG: sigma-54-dependent Fis family transcriptional regulator [Bdellovibrionaceae bacterium]|nr:sigma-54-dependent Fis family transcriptional regulator [Pseudobdellovibrionaceae bacterium]